MAEKVYEKGKHVPIKLEQKDIEKLKEMLKYHPDSQRVVSAISGLMTMQDLANELKYPINSFGDLVRQLGEDRIISISDKEMKLVDLKAVMPAYYFPIVSEENFFDKASELMKARPEMLLEQIPGSMMQSEQMLRIGEEVSPGMAPPIPPDLEKFKPSQIPPRGFVGLRKDEVERMRARKEVV
jgi:hypothetical protein